MRHTPSGVLTVTAHSNKDAAVVLLVDATGTDMSSSALRSSKVRHKLISAYLYLYQVTESLNTIAKCCGTVGWPCLPMKLLAQVTPVHYDGGAPSIHVGSGVTSRHDFKLCVRADPAERSLRAYLERPRAFRSVAHQFGVAARERLSWWLRILGQERQEQDPSATEVPHRPVHCPCSLRSRLVGRGSPRPLLTVYYGNASLHESAHSDSAA
jgi:hypothetical protein